MLEAVLLAAVLVQVNSVLQTGVSNLQPEVWAGEPYGCVPDVAHGPRGEAVVSSDVMPVVWRRDGATGRVTRHELVLDAHRDRDVGFSGLLWSAEHGTYFAYSRANGGLWRIDPGLRRAQAIALSERISDGCALRRLSRTRFARFCVLGERGDFAIDLAPDQRSGTVRRGCRDD